MMGTTSRMNAHIHFRLHTINKRLTAKSSFTSAVRKMKGENVAC